MIENQKKKKQLNNIISLPESLNSEYQFRIKLSVKLCFTNVINTIAFETP